jgi:hypothetical protein
MLGDGTGVFAVPMNFAAGNNPCTVSVADFNKDGIEDLATANYSGGNVSVFLGELIPRQPIHLEAKRKREHNTPFQPRGKEK